MATMSDNLKGALLMSAGMAAFVVNDALVKTVSDRLPLFQAVFLRGIATTLMIVLLARAHGALTLRLPPADLRRLGLRTACEVAATWTFLTALFNMPIANATAILMVAPLVVSLAAAVFLGEPLGWRRLAAICAGLGGVLLIVRPGAEGFNVYSLYALASVLVITVRDIATRGMTSAIPSLTVALSAAVAVTCFAGLVSLGAEWRPVDASVALRLAGASVAIVGGYVFMVAAMRTGDMATVTPFRYTGLVWALILGLAVFGDWPDLLTLAGAAIIVATGVFTLRREQRLARDAADRARADADTSAGPTAGPTARTRAPDGGARPSRRGAVDTPGDSH